MPATKFDKPVFPGAKLVSATVTVTNTSGSYSNTFIDERIATSMRAFQLEIEDPSVFNDKISITTSDGSFTIACDEVAGETDVTVGFLKIADDPTAISSTEFTTLNNRIGDLSDLETTDQTSMVNAVNEVVGDVSDNTQAIANLFVDVSRMQSVSLEHDAVEHTYTIPYDGWYYFYAANNGTDGAVSIRLRNSLDEFFFMSNPAAHDAYMGISTGMYHFKQGTTVKYRLQSTAIGLVKYVKDI